MRGFPLLGDFKPCTEHAHDFAVLVASLGDTSKYREKTGHGQDSDPVGCLRQHQRAADPSKDRQYDQEDNHRSDLRSSSALTLDSRPTTNGVIINGKMTTSRMGIMGNFLLSNFSFGFDKLSLPSPC